MGECGAGFEIKSKSESRLRFWGDDRLIVGWVYSLAMKVFVLDLGWLECDLNWMVSLAVIGTRANPTPAARWVRIPIYAVLIDHPDGAILYDTGCHPDAMKGYWPEGLQTVFPFYHLPEQTLDAQLARCGTSVDRIRRVVLSHLHCDHAGNLHRFAQAEVLVPDADYAHAQALVAANPQLPSHGAYIRDDIRCQIPCLTRVREEVEIAKGVQLLNLPGHTPGLLGVLLKLDRGANLLFPQDALYTPANYGPPARASGIVYDSLSFLASIEKIRRLAQEHQAQVMFSHDEKIFRTLRKAPEFYS